MILTVCLTGSICEAQTRSVSDLSPIAVASSATVTPADGTTRNEFEHENSGPSSGPSGTALRFIPIDPCRIADTRDAGQSNGGPILANKEVRVFTIAGAACGIPSTAAAYSLNVTVVPHGPLSWLTLWPTGQSQPTVSTLNSTDGRTKANAAIVPAGTNGSVSVFVSDSSHVILDVAGYFVPSNDASALAYYPVIPCRVVDTRGPDGSLAGPYLRAGQEREFAVTSGGCNIPGNARAYSFNFTAVPKRPLGYLAVWPSGGRRPLVSTLNAPTGATTANA
ncbi:MAG: hypothetical protein ACJ74Y_11105, partial [Bryobacteraceae bacterium]